MDKTMKIVLVILYASWLTSLGCSVPTMFNPDSYGKKWENTFLWFDPCDLNMIYVSEDANFNNAKEVPNGNDYAISWDKEAAIYTLKVASFKDPVAIVSFEGYAAKDYEEEQPWIFDGMFHILESTKLLPTEDGRYSIMLSQNLTH